MNHLDIILVIPLAIGALRGFIRGFILEIASLIGLIAGVFLAAMFADVAGDFILQYVQWSPNAVKIIAFVLIFIGVIIVVRVVAKGVEKVFELAGLSFLNRIAGLGAGVLKVAFILSVVLIFFNYINRDNALMSEETRQESFLYPKIEMIVPMMMPGSNFLSLDYTIQQLNSLKEMNPQEEE